MPELGVAKLPVVPAMDQSLVEPEVRRSVNGVLSTSLRCAHAYRDIGGKHLYLRSYEGGLGPTLRMKPGETLKIQLINDLPPNRDLLPSNPSHPHQFNNTNFHFHGAHCSPSGIADNVMRLMEPGKSLRAHCRTVSWLTMMPRAASNSSTMRSPSGKRKYSHTAWPMISAGNRYPA
jgi:FtsP/CotA-like multicopper oxidase with cupredoxin domain